MRALFVAHPCLMGERVSPVCVSASQGTGVGCLGERGLSFHIPSGVLGFPLTPCPALLPSCSVSFPSAAETSPGMCSEWNLFSCLSSWSSASLTISDLSGILFLLTLIFRTWKQCHGVILGTLHLSSCFPPYLLLQRKHKGNEQSAGCDTSLNCMHSFTNCPTTKSVHQNLLSFKIVWCWELYTKASLLTLGIFSCFSN